MNDEAQRKADAIKQAVERIKGQPLFEGQLCACWSNPRVLSLVRYEGNQAVCDDLGKEVRYPRSEIFDPKKAINVANHFLNVGFWHEGMESMILTLEPKKKGE